MTTIVLNTTTRKIEAFSSARDVLARAYGHDNKLAVEAATVPAGISQLFLRGYAEAGDGGAASYKRVVSEPGHAGKIQSADGAWWEIAERLYTFKQFGATGDGTTDDTAAINNTVSAAATTGVARVHGPAGTYIISAEITGQSGIHIFGDGIGATILKRANNADNVHLLSFDTISKFSLSRLTVDGNRSNNSTSGHGIRLDDVSDFEISDVRIVNPYSYGIGMQGNWHKRGACRNIWIEGAGADGIDIKNYSSANEGLVFDGIYVIDCGMNKTDQAGIDTRGPVQMTNIHVTISASVVNASWGLRFRFGDAAGPPGGEHVSLTNFSVIANSATVGLGGVYAGAPNARITNGRVSKCVRGVFAAGGGFGGHGIITTAVVVNECTHGFTDSGEDNQWAGCSAQACTGDGFSIESSTRCRIIGGTATGNNKGYDWTGATTPVLIGVYAAGNTSADWSGSLTEVHWIGPLNWGFALPLANGSGVKQGELGTTTSPVNFLRFSGGATGSSPDMSAQGADTNIDLALTPKGTGKVRFGTHSAVGAETVTGFIEIKDAGGTLRKVAVVS